MAFPTQESVVLENEQELGCKLPLSFRNRILRDNGGEIEFNYEKWQIFPVYDKTNRKTISRTCNSISKETKSAREWRGFPENAIAIATNASGDFLVLIQENDKLRNEVYMWLHETKNLIKIVSDFSELS